MIPFVIFFWIELSAKNSSETIEASNHINIIFQDLF
jgi:hypothetical protein